MFRYPSGLSAFLSWLKLKFCISGVTHHRMWQFCLQFFLSFRENFVSLTHGKWLTETDLTQSDIVRSKRRAVTEKRQTGAERSVFCSLYRWRSHFVLRLLRKPLFSAAIGWNFCRFVFVLLRTAWVLKSSKDLNLCFHAEAVTWWPGLINRSVFRVLPKFCTSYNNQISDVWWELCKES